MYEITRMRDEHREELVKNIRQVDAEEIWAYSGRTPRDVMDELEVVGRHTALAGLANGALLCLFGAQPFTALSSVATPWLLGTNALQHNTPAFLRMSKKWVQQQMKVYDTLVNFVDARNVKSIRWLKWLGFKVYPAVPTGPFQQPFHRFEMRNV
tara:strand:- start:9243 stop:9704 length:462 start_codon:yes stop_codon:yes gene_type:complete